jgi:hypothetical protein
LTVEMGGIFVIGVQYGARKPIRPALRECISVEG